MKILKIILIIFVVFVVLLGVSTIVFINTFDANKFKDQLVQEASKSINREIGIQDISIDVSLQEGVVLDVNNFYIKDDPDFSDDYLFFTDSIYLNVDVMAYVLRRQIAVSKVNIKDPRIKFIVNKDKETNFERLAGKKASPTAESQSKTEGQPPVDTKTSTPDVKQKGKDSKSIPDLLVETIEITDGYFTFIDRTAETEVVFPVKGLDLHVSNLSFKEPFKFVFRCSLWSGDKNILFNGLAQMDETAKQIRIDDLSSTIYLSEFSIDQINKSLPSFSETGLEKGLEGEIQLNIDQLIVGQEGLLILVLNGRLFNGQIKLEALGDAIKDINGQFEISEANAVLQELEMNLASGKVMLSGRLNDYLSNQDFSYKMRLDGLKLEQLIPDGSLPIVLEGIVNGAYEGSGKGVSEEALKTLLTTEGDFRINEGKIIDVNLLQLVLSKISFIPNLEEKIEAGLSERYKEKLKLKDTVVDRFEVTTKVQEGFIYINSVVLEADGFVLTANGKMDFEENVNLNADFYITEELTNSLIAAEGELAALKDESGQIHIPFKPYQGKIDKFVPYPDLKDFTKKVIQNKGKEELEKVLRKALDLDDDPVNGEASDDENSNEPKEQKPEEVLLENILGTIPLFN